VAGFSSLAAAVAIEAGERPLEALRFLEQGRGVVAGSFDDVRANISPDLQMKHPDLVREYVALREEVSRREYIYCDDGLDITPGEREKELTESIANIRRQSGFEDFLQPPSEEAILAAASSGPIVTINISSLRCDAVIVDSRGVRSLALPRLGLHDAFDMLRNHRPDSLQVLEWLWDVIAEPVLAALGFDGRREDGADLPRVW
jgi:hypothetical protein